jgi:Na+-transporting methylmalonyl-CoA/oxaloacetate decarboxylase gamma subunit
MHAILILLINKISRLVERGVHAIKKKEKKQLGLVPTVHMQNIQNNECKVVVVV